MKTLFDEEDTIDAYAKANEWRTLVWGVPWVSQTNSEWRERAIAAFRQAIENEQWRRNA